MLYSSPLIKARSRSILPHTLLPASIVLFLILLTGCTTSFTDISPNNAGDPPTGGLTLALAGGDASLYAVSLNGGLWYGRRTESGRRRWAQSQGPKDPQCVAVDDAHPNHVIVGDKNGQARETRLNENGLWESFDGGVSFSYAWNPMQSPATNPSNGTLCSSQIVQSVVFTSTSAVIAATTCGIARRENGLSDFTVSTVPDGTGFISNLAAGKQKVWAKTLAGILLVSTDDGKTFTNATSQPMPGGISFSVTGDYYSLAASDNKVMLSVCCAKTGPGPIKDHPANELLIYDADNDSWNIETFSDGAGLTSTDGTYAGGRRFVRSFFTNRGWRFFFCNGQSVWETDLAGNHTLMATSGIDNPGKPMFTGNIHADFWDFFLDKNGAGMWVACDGGIYENNSDGRGWLPSMDGYHTQAVQSLDIFYDPNQTLVAYTTQDNGAWKGRWPDWTKNIVANTGDVNFSDNDPGSETMEFFYHSRNVFMLLGVDGTTPSISSDVAPVSTFADPYQPDTPGIIQFVKGLPGETGTPPDALMIVQRPMRNNTDPATDPTGSPITPPPGLEGIDQAGNPWLLRNYKFSEEPDLYRAMAKGNWIKELDDLPNGTYRVLESGGHRNTHYYAIVQQGSGLSSLWERKWIRGIKRQIWTKVFDGIIALTSQCYPWEGWYGPVFVNPYDDSKIYLLAPDAVKVSHRDEQGNLVFKNDDVLTRLISASGTYPLVRQFCTGNENNVLKGQRLLGETTLGTVSFFRDDPKRTLVSSPCTGVFYDDGGGKWRSFSNVMPRGNVWEAKMDGDKAYIGFAGRGVGMVDYIGYASLGTYFIRASGFHPQLGGGQSIIAKLYLSDGTVAAGSQVACRITAADGSTVFWSTALTLDSQGQVLVPLFPLPAGCIVHLHFTGSESDGLASCEFHYAN